MNVRQQSRPTFITRARVAVITTAASAATVILSTASALALTVAISGCSGEAPRSVAATPGRYVDDSSKFYAEVFKDNRFYLFSSPAALATFEGSGEAPQTRTFIAQGPKIGERKSTIVVSEADPKTLLGGHDEANAKNKRIMRTFRARYMIPE